MRTATWSGIGKDVNKCKDMDHVLKASGLDYDVAKMPISVLGSEEAIPNRFITGRPADGGFKLYDVVSDKFEIIQNRDAFDFVNYMGDEIQYEKAGETAGGMVYIIAKLPKVNILGDAFTPHVIFRNGFNGKVKITAAITPLRMICQNQFNFAFKNAANAITIRHTSNAEAKLSEAKEVLRLSADYMQELNNMAEHFAKMKMSKKKIEQVVDYLFPMEDVEHMNSFKRNRLETARAGFIKAHETEDNRNFKGTAWGLINAYTDYMTHKDPMGNSETKHEGKFVSTTFKVSMNPILNAIEAIH